MNIAFFDSGIGGLSVLKQALTELPNANYLYYADTDNTPYGTKSREAVQSLIAEAVAFLAEFNIDALVIACNTATSVSVAHLRQQYDFPIIGMEPAVKLASQSQCSTEKNIAVTATSLTLAECKLEYLINTLSVGERVEKIDLDRLVCFAEQWEFDSPAVRDYLQQQLAGVSAQTHDSIVLGCTHFVFFRDLIQETVGQGVSVIDGNAGTVKQLRHALGAMPSNSSATEIMFFSSGVAVSLERRRALLTLLKPLLQ